MSKEARYKVSLEDKGQDLLHFITDEDGQVLEATTPFLTSIYKGAYIPIEQQVIGTACMIHNPPHQNFGFLKYKAIEIKDLTVEPKGIFYVTQAGTSGNLTPTVVGTFSTREEATKVADEAFQTMLSQVDEAYPEGNGSLPDVYAVWSNEEYIAAHCQAEACCDKGTEIEPHTCPYKEEINNDHETLCTCCAHCTNECMMDI